MNALKNQTNFTVFSGSDTQEFSAEYLADVPKIEFSDGNYVVRFARTKDEIDAALRLRFEVFNLELREGLDESYLTGFDQDEFDSACHHLLVSEKSSGKIVGTYRLQTLESARSGAGLYCANEFETENLPAQVLAESLEIGRACIAREHRHTRVLFLLWKGLAAYMLTKNKRYLFGCCSLTSQDTAQGWQAARLIESEDFLHRELFIEPRENFVCAAEESVGESVDFAFELPKLFLTYMRFGAKVCSPPAIDREFKTIDFFVMFDLETIDEKYRKLFLSGF